MIKGLSWRRFQQVQLRTYISVSLVLIAAIQFFACYIKYYYDYIPTEELIKHLYSRTNPKLVINKSKPNCTYDDILMSSKSMAVWDVPKKYDEFLNTGIMNGSYSPDDCNPLYSVAILVTYRNRQSQLDIFIPYMHNYLRKQRIHYKIYVVEQQDNKPWNKGLLYNIGAKQAIADNFPCLILHDVDLLPLDEGNLYVCLKQPRHMSASIDKFRYVLIYKSLVGGVLAITSEQYRKINGFSHAFKGWGGEDDDLAERIVSHNLEILRLSPLKSRYTMMSHKQETSNKERFLILTEIKGKAHSDGLNSLQHYPINIINNRLFTKLAVRFRSERGCIFKKLLPISIVF